MKSNKRQVILIIIGIIIFSNLPPVYYFIGEEYHYQNLDASFEFTEQPGTTQNFDIALLRFQSFKRKHPENPKTLYRTFSIKPWKFWEWYNYLTNRERMLSPFLRKDL